MRSAIIAAAVALLVSAAGATAATVITGSQIKDGTVTGKDIRNGAIKRADLAPSARGLRGPVGLAGANGAKGDTGAQGPQGPSQLFTTSNTDVGTAAPGTTATVRPQCPHGTAVGMIYNMGDNSTGDPKATVTGMVLHETTAALSVRNFGSDPIGFSATITCVDTHPFS